MALGKEEEAGRWRRCEELLQLSYKGCKEAAGAYWAVRGLLVGPTGPLGPWALSDPTREAFTLNPKPRTRNPKS